MVRSARKAAERSRKRGPKAPDAASCGGWRYLIDATERDRLSRTGAQVTSRTPKW